MAIIIRVLYLLIFFFLNCSFAQNKITVNGSKFNIRLANQEYNKKIVIENSKTTVDYSFASDDSKPGSFKLPVNEIFIAIPNNSKPNIKAISFSRIQIDAVPSLNNYSFLLNDSTIISKPSTSADITSWKPFQLVEVLGFQRIRDFYLAHVKINAVEYDALADKTFEYKDVVIQTELPQGTNISENTPIIVSSAFDQVFAELIANSDNAEQFRIKDEISTYENSNDNWINYSSDYVKIGVARDGIYKIGKDEIEKAGYNVSSINPKTFQLFKTGVEQPIVVYGEDDLVFDEQDYIEFYGTKNYSTVSPRVINKNDEEYYNLMNKYTDTTFFFLTWNNKNGMRVKNKVTVSTAITDTLNYYDEFLHLEEHPIDALFYTFSESQVRNQLPYWETSKSWYWRWLASWSASISQTFQVINLAANKTASFYAKVASFGSNQAAKPHFVKFNLNNTKLDSIYLDRFGRVLLKGTSSTLLKSGSNTFNLTYKENNGSTSGICLLDWLEVEYPKKLELNKDSLTFAYRAELQPKILVVKISNASNNEYSIYRTKPTLLKISDYKIVNKNLVFSDTVGSGYEFSIAAKQKLLIPETINKKRFLNVRSKLAATDYVAITHRKFSNSVQNYLNIISNKQKLKPSLYFVNDIYDEFGYGYPTPEAIKDFVKYLISNSPKPLPSYLTLIGDANYDYKGIRKKQAGVRVGENYVPSYGFPVSDNWYVINDSSSSFIPQMFVGRIPINHDHELDLYATKVDSEINQNYDEWNKRFLFFSGGSGSQSEIDNLRIVQQKVIDQYIKPAPLSGIYDHFYKIKGNDFGPYSQEYINNSISNGALFISYLGHSGTATWDNSISDVSQLKNYRNRYFFVSDFGCSTNKFAEPDIVCFGERFLLSKDGQALGYIGNAALGFTSLAYTAPILFFESLVKYKAKSIGQIHWLTKSKMFSLIGNSETAKLFSYSNTLIGDPVLELRLPDKPNLAIKSSDIVIFGVNQINDSQDSVECKIFINNYGLTSNSKYSLMVYHIFDQKMVLDKQIIKELPNRLDSVTIKLAVKNLPGHHTIKIELDSKKEIVELNENDNVTTTTFFVSSNQIRDLLVTSYLNSSVQNLVLLSPHQKPSVASKIFMRSSNRNDFENYSQQEIIPEAFFTKVHSANTQNERLWFKLGVFSRDTIWGQPKSFTSKNTSKLSINDSEGYKSLRLKKLTEKNNSITFRHENISIGVISAGLFAGSTCLITLDGKNTLDNTYFQGIGISIFNPAALTLEDSKSFDLFNNHANHNAFEAFVKSIPNGKIIALGISGDAVNNNSTQFRNVLKSIGSTKADSIQFKGSWAFIGVKGGNPSTFLEVVKSPFSGLISINQNFTKINSDGELSTDILGPVAKWKNITVAGEDNPNLKSFITTIGFLSTTSKGDTIYNKLITNGNLELNSVKHPYCQFIVRIVDETKRGVGSLKKIDIDYIGTSELGTNYQVVSVSKDTLDQGEKVNLNFAVYNVGESTASNFKVRVDLIKKDNSKEKLFEQVVDSIQTEKKKDFAPAYTTDKITGSNHFQITIDTENSVTELYKDNNFYSVPFYVKLNSKPASIKLTIDGSDIINGDFISSKPNFKIELNDESLIPITDTSKVLLYLNNKRIYFANDSNILTYSYSSNNPKLVVNYNPTLADGNYTFKVVGKNATDQIIDSTGIVRKFTVKNQFQLLNAYNYPNPFKGETHFTFKLTQLPDELKILIYTIAGRKIKEIKLGSSDLRYDFNRIYWDGRDEDGDILGNGVYIYKIISHKGSEKTELTQKLSILR